MNTVYTLAFTFFLLTSQQDPDAPTIPIHTEREVAFYDRECGGPVTTMEECKIVADRRKERAETAIRNSPNKIFKDEVEVTCFEYEKPAAKKRHKK